MKDQQAEVYFFFQWIAYILICFIILIFQAWGFSPGVQEERVLALILLFYS